MFMQTASGRSFHPTNPTVDVIDIGDIAHALSHICRFAGHTRYFYSVAQHSVLVADIVKNKGGSRIEQLDALMHDAAEAYLMDVPTPVKKLLTNYKEIENKVHACIAERYDLSYEMPALVHLADGIALATEAEALMINSHLWELPHDAEDYSVESMTPLKARRAFLKRFKELYEGKI